MVVVVSALVWAQDQQVSRNFGITSGKSLQNVRSEESVLSSIIIITEWQALILLKKNRSFKYQVPIHMRVFPITRPTGFIESHLCTVNPEIFAY